MLDEKQLEMLPERIYQRLNSLNTSVLETIGKRIGEISKLSASDVHKLERLKSFGADLSQITAQLSEISRKSKQEIMEIFETVAKENYEFAEEYYSAIGKEYVPYAENKILQRYVEAMAVQTFDSFTNMSQTTAFMVYDEAGNKVLSSLSRTYQDVIDKAVTAVSTGTTDYKSAMRQTLKDLADSGLRTKYQPLKNKSSGKVVDYASGYSRRLDTAVRQNILWGVKQCNQGMSDIVGSEFGNDGWEISYHSGARPSHIDMGGRQYAIGEAQHIDGRDYPPFSTVADLLKDYGCLHFKLPIILGVSVATYSDEELEKLKASDRETIEFEGKTYTKYEATQMQRKLETAMRNAKDRQIIAKAAGDDTLRRQEQEKINQLSQKYKEFSDSSGLPTKMERASVAGYHKVKTQGELKRNSAISNVLNSEEGSGIILTEKLFRKAERREHNTGVFSNLEVPMQKRYVLSFAHKYGIDTKGLTFKIQRSEHLLSTDLVGATDPDNIGRIDLFPKAFSTEEELIKTILHEKCHVLQLQKYGKQYTQNNIGNMEKRAYRFQDLYFYILSKKVKK